LAGQPGSLSLRPVLEPAISIQVKPIQKWSGVARDCRGWVILFQGAGERCYIARDHGRIEAQLDRPEEELALVKIAAKGIAGLF
jgi:hypothetical protein